MSIILSTKSAQVVNLGATATMVSLFIGHAGSLSLHMSYGGRGGGFGGPKPVEEGKEYELEVTEVSQKGDGIARVRGFVIFVKGGKTGEKVKVKITSVGPRFAIAEKV